MSETRTIPTAELINRLRALPDSTGTRAAAADRLEQLAAEVEQMRSGADQHRDMAHG